MTTSQACPDKDACGPCYYCLAPLSPRHEHDHFPAPAHLGGTATVAVCINCHDLKDRVPLGHWSSELLERAMSESGPYGRILLAKLAGIMADLEARILATVEDVAA